MGCRASAEKPIGWVHEEKSESAEASIVSRYDALDCMVSAAVVVVSRSSNEFETKSTTYLAQSTNTQERNTEVFR